MSARRKPTSRNHNLSRGNYKRSDYTKEEYISDENNNDIHPVSTFKRIINIITGDDFPKIRIQLKGDNNYIEVSWIDIESGHTVLLQRNVAFYKLLMRHTDGFRDEVGDNCESVAAWNKNIKDGNGYYRHLKCKFNVHFHGAKSKHGEQILFGNLKCFGSAGWEPAAFIEFLNELASEANDNFQFKMGFPIPKVTCSIII